MWSSSEWSDMARQADLLELAQTVMVALVFAFMLSKLIAMVMSILSSVKEGKLRLERVPAAEGLAGDEVLASSSSDEKESIRSMEDSEGDRADVSGLSEGRADVSEVSEPECLPRSEPEQEKPGFEEESKVDDMQEEVVEAKDTGYERSGSSSAEVEPARVVEKDKQEGDDDDSSDWEGVESTELDEAFAGASGVVAVQVGAFSREAQLQLYGLYKLATEGPCRAPQPSPLKVSARAKWNAWNKLGDMTTEQAMERYVALVSDNIPGWDTAKTEAGNVEKAKATQQSGGAMGPVFSSLALETGAEGELEAIHAAAREGDERSVIELLEQGVAVDLRDGDGGTALHWACDRGHLNLVEVLIAKGADIHAEDKDGQTALHIAATNDQEAVAKYLVKQGANPRAKDSDSTTALNLCPADWGWMNSD